MIMKKDQKLLFEYMTEQQIADYKKKGYFWVVGSDRCVYQLSDGQSLWRFYNGIAVESRHVWAHDYEKGLDISKETSLLTQLLFLTSDSASLLVTLGCGGITFEAKRGGCPPMDGWRAVVA